MEKLNQMPEPTSEEIFQRYVEDLDLKPEDFDGKILDVGAGGAEFAKWAREHNVSSEIYSLEPSDDIKDSSTGVKGRAEKLPFRDNEFDLIVSNCAIPNIFLGGDKATVKKQIKDSLTEFVGVAKDGGEIRLGKILKGDLYESQRDFTEALDEVLEELREKQNLTIEEIPTNQDTYEYDELGNKTRLLAKTFLVKIRK